MSIRLRELLMQELDELRYEPTDKRIRSKLGDLTVIDSTRAMLVWEPKRIVPTYAVPVEDIAGEIGAAPAAPAGEESSLDDAPQLAGRPVLDPSIPFSVHTTEGEPLTIRGPAGHGEAAAFRPSDPALAGYVIVDFDAFDAWYEEDERNLGHPRDPFHRIDIVHSSRHVRVERDGELLAESSNPCLLFEPPLPVRYYLPPEDLRTDLLRPSEKKTFCAYKGQASYWSLGGEGDIAWSYPEPLREAAELTGRIAFLNEWVDIVVDGKPLERPVTPWSRR
ncbi:MAG: DUF427 domain-containing protein [Actinomycetota bacterium]|nr:DUF427 domain-containing protein [Actinomycetota bacterium]